MDQPNKIAFNQPYYFLHKSTTDYQLFLLSPLEAGRAMCFKRTLDFDSCWTVLFEDVEKTMVAHTYNEHKDGSLVKAQVPTKLDKSVSNPQKKIEQEYLAQRIDFPIKDVGTKKEIVIHCYVKTGDYLERSQMIIELEPKSKDHQEANNVQATQQLEGSIAYDVPYVHLYKSKFKVVPEEQAEQRQPDDTDKLCFYPRVLLCLKDYKLYEQAPKGMLGKEAYINNETSNAYSTIIPLIRKNKNSSVRMHSDLAVNEKPYFENKTIDGYFEAIVARADNGEELDELIRIGKPSVGSFKEQRKYVINNFSNTPTTRSIGASAHIITGTPPANGANIVPATNLFIDQAT